MNSTVALVGDVMLDREPHPSFALSMLRSAEIASANLEVALTVGGPPADKPIVLRGPPDAAVHLGSIGLNVVSFANNHALDYGVDAFLSTIALVRKAGVAVTGAGADLDDALRPTLIELSGVKTAWLGFASTLPSGFAAAPGRPGVAPIRVETSLIADPALTDEQPGSSPFVVTRVYEDDLERATIAVSRARNEADIVFVHMHWGVPPGFAPGFQGTLAQYQRPLARALVDAGATVIIGHHPHCLHGIEVIGESLVLYSTGHFVFHALDDGRSEATIASNRPGPPYQMEAMLVPQLKQTAVFLLRFDGTSLRQLEVVPCTLDAAGESEIAKGHEAVSILEWVSQLSKECGSDLKVEGERGFLLL